ncbi:complement C1q-like protein 4 [Siniperca chuatsi]|uniref:complement C1q-like protein 4 n=1 Tax=Siniperca chuatsi TaxID=119488 RepID=UPI001CE10C2B|nr:complement C1q-like protein 4 [Siniperca chuatsi]
MGDKKVMFTAVADHGGEYGPFSTDRTLIFNRVITNSGDAYNPTSGIFVAPYAAVYYFTFFYHAGGARKSALSLIKSNNVIVKTSDDSADFDTDKNAGNVAFLHLKAGEEVSVRLPAHSRVWAAGSTTSFSGFLVTQL